MSRVRSPNHPRSSLPEALEKARILYHKDYTNAMSRETVATHLGYGGLNGSSLRDIAALIQYDLLEKSGDDLKLTDDAVALLVDLPDSYEYQEALKRATNAPALFAELGTKFPDNLPSEDNLSRYLQKKGFTPEAAKVAAQAYRATLEFVAQTQNHSSKATVVENPVPETSLRKASYLDSQSTAGFSSSESQLMSKDVLAVTFPLPRGNFIEIRLRSKVSPAEFESILKIIEALKPGLVDG